MGRAVYPVQAKKITTARYENSRTRIECGFFTLPKKESLACGVDRFDGDFFPLNAGVGFQPFFAVLGDACFMEVDAHRRPSTAN